MQLESVVRRGNPDYGQLTGIVQKTLIKRFKKACLDLDIEMSEGIEQAVELWLDLAVKPVEEKNSDSTKEAK